MVIAAGVINDWRDALNVNHAGRARVITEGPANE